MESNAKLTQFINYCWRLLATAFSFMSFGLGGLFLRLIIFPMIGIIPLDAHKKQKLCQRCVHYSFYWFIGLMHKLGIMTYAIHGLEKLNKPGQLIIANHPTLVDIVFLISRIPEANCIVKHQLLNNPYTRGPVLNAGYISNGESQQMITECVEWLQKGGVLIIFPEGTRTVPGKDYVFQRGAARIALQAKTTVTPVTLTCTPSTLTKNKKWYQIPDRPFHLVMDVGNDMVISDFFSIQPESIAVRRLNRFFQDYFSQQRVNNE